MLDSHRWNFCSYIVSGIISAYEYQLVPGDNFEAFDCFRSDNRELRHAIVRLNWSCALGIVTTWKRGDFYTQSFGDLHRAAAVREAYTLILHGSSLSDRSLVIRERTRVERPSTTAANIGYPNTRSISSWQMLGAFCEHRRRSGCRAICEVLCHGYGPF